MLTIALTQGMWLKPGFRGSGSNITSSRHAMSIFSQEKFRTCGLKYISGTGHLQLGLLRKMLAIKLLVFKYQKITMFKFLFLNP